MKFVFHRSKLQAGSSNDDYQTKPHLIRAIRYPRPTTACSDQFGGATKGGGEAEEGGVAHRSLSDDYHRKF
jgi:hypothetical protein